MCIRDRLSYNNIMDSDAAWQIVSDLVLPGVVIVKHANPCGCLLYTSDAADDLLCVDLGGRRIIKKKNLLPTILGRLDNAPYLS